MQDISDCQMRGFASPLDKVLFNSKMQRATLEALLEAMKEYLPNFHQYLRAKAEAMGHKNGLPWYDLFAPVAESSATYTVEEAKAYLMNIFENCNPRMAEIADRAFEEEWIDFFPREGKVGGAFCADVGCIGQSRILTNFDGQYGDMVTLAHELGHAFHSQCVRPHRVLNHDYSMPLAETASTFNECVLNAAAIARAEDPEEKLGLIESQLQNTTQVIVDIYSRFLFEASVFEKREAEFMNADALCALMLEAQEKSYGDGLDPDIRHPYMWICKPHYYGPTFYNFPYAFGALFAQGLYAQYEKEGAAFVPKYKKLLFTTSVATAEDTAKVAGIDLTDKAFWRSALESVAKDIDQFCTLVEK
jgi:pepF/M3 family oligoendopeptidase